MLKPSRWSSGQRAFLGAVLVSALGVVVLAYVAWMARLLRPIADDYCFGSVSGRGFGGSIWFWWMQWSGELVGVVTNTVLVGLPLAHLPWWAASSTALIAAAGAVLLLALTLFSVLSSNSCSSAKLRTIGYVTLAVLVVPLSWWSFWWVPAVLDSEGPSGDVSALAGALTHWQNLNGGYVVVTALGFMTYVGVIWGLRPRGSLGFAASVFVGLVTGLSGALYVASAFVTLSIIWTLLWLVVHRIRRYVWVMHGGFLLGAIGGFILWASSPGGRLRAAAQSVGLPPIRELWQWTFPAGLANWFEFVWNPGGAVALLLVATTCALLVRAGWSVQSDRALALAGGLLCWSLVYSILSRVVESGVYQAYWHRIPTGIAVFAAELCLAVAFGNWVARSSRLLMVGAAAVLLVSAPMSVLAIGWMTASMQSRVVAWDAGPAPLPRLADIEDGSGWVKCWADLGKFRDIPDRIPPGMTIPAEAPGPS